MEKHIFKFGGGSWAIVIPKAWVEKNGIDGKSNANMYEDDVGNIVLSAKNTAAKEAELLIDSTLSPEVAGRWVGLYYRNGVKKLNVYSKDGATEKQFERIQDLVGRVYPGFEIISRSRKAMVLEDFTDMKEVTSEKVMLRLRSLINEELSEMAQGNAGSIVKLEELVNRIFNLGIRYVNVIQGKDAIKYFKIFQLLETISDQLCELSKIQEMKKSKGIFEVLGKEFGLCFKGLEGDYQSMEQALKVRDSVYKMLGKTGALGVYLLTEIAKNMIKISEFGLEIKQKELVIES